MVIFETPGTDPHFLANFHIKEYAVAKVRPNTLILYYDKTALNTCRDPNIWSIICLVWALHNAAAGHPRLAKKCLQYLIQGCVFLF